VRPIAPGEVLFKEGDRGFSFYVVLEGAIEIVEQSRGTPHEVTVHESGEFTGDVDTLSGRRARHRARDRAQRGAGVDGRLSASGRGRVA
jgi:thioredoxin reductase (NADPH)